MGVMNDQELARAEVQQRIIDALDERLPINSNIAALAFVLCQCVQLSGMPKGKFVDALAATYDVVAFHNELRGK